MDWAEVPLEWASYLFGWSVLAATIIGIIALICFVFEVCIRKGIYINGINVWHMIVFVYLRRGDVSPDRMERFLASAIKCRREIQNIPKVDWMCPLCGGEKETENEDA